MLLLEWCRYVLILTCTFLTEWPLCSASCHNLKNLPCRITL